MAGIESIDKLRKMDDGMLVPLGNGQYVPDHSHNDIADEIESEIAERYMELPVDADGVPIHVGDEIMLLSGKRDTVRFITHRMTDVVFNERGWVPNLCRHVKPRTLEDVLEEFASKQHGITTEENDALIAKYADEIRGLL